MTAEQEAYLIKLADKGLAEEAAEVLRLEASAKANEQFLARQVFIAELKAQQQAEFETALATFEESQK